MSALASVLSDATILELVQTGRIKIDPWDPGLVQPASVDLVGGVELDALAAASAVLQQARARTAAIQRAGSLRRRE